ncbi:MAG: histone deacetylase, partial [Acidobacteria bacterium]
GERIRALIEAFAKYSGPVSRFDPHPIAPKWLEAVHSPNYVARLRGTRGLPPRDLDPDTHTGPRSYEVACLAAGSGIHLLELMRQGQIQAGFLLARPPGHHATPTRAMGFCLFNNAAIAAQWAIQERVASRVAIVDFDVHHGNGTQQIFWTRPDVVYVSSHQYPHYPGTGAFTEVGAGAGKGYTVNFPVQAGRGDSFFVPLYRALVVPVLRQFNPDLVLVSAGYDTHASDPLAGMKMTADGFGAIAALLTGLAKELCQGRILFLLEGGYDLEGLSEGVVATIDAAVGARDFSAQAAQGPSREFEAYREGAIRHVGKYWKVR